MIFSRMAGKWRHKRLLESDTSGDTNKVVSITIVVTLSFILTGLLLSLANTFFANHMQPLSNSSDLIALIGLFGLC